MGTFWSWIKKYERKVGKETVECIENLHSIELLLMYVDDPTIFLFKCLTKKNVFKLVARFKFRVN